MFSVDEIRAGYDAGEFFLEYLPTVSLVDNCCIGAEALIRWRLPDRIVPPLEFIPLIENTPLSGVITYWVVETVGRELGGWMREHDEVYVSINVPPELLGRGGLHYAVRNSNMMDQATKLMLELTERGVPDALGIAAIAEANRAGIMIALDDVNLNEANLVALSRLKLDVVKFDKSFADRMLSRDWRVNEMDGLAALVLAAGFKIIIEGVETIGQVEILRKAGLLWVQGFYFSEPLPVAEFLEYFSAHH